MFLFPFFQSNRVVMKIDVTHLEHPSLIGKGGKLIKKVMESTGCHIHFPDGNIKCSGPEKSNHVSMPYFPFLKKSLMYFILKVHLLHCPDFNQFFIHSTIPCSILLCKIFLPKMVFFQNFLQVAWFFNIKNSLLISINNYY